MFISKKEIGERLCFLEDSMNAMEMNYETIYKKIKKIEKDLKPSIKKEKK